MAGKNTYVSSVNGDAGTFYGYLDNRVEIDSTNIKIEGTTGNNIVQQMQSIASTMRPMIVEKIDQTESDYVIKVGAGIPY